MLGHAVEAGPECALLAEFSCDRSIARIADAALGVQEPEGGVGRATCKHGYRRRYSCRCD